MATSPNSTPLPSRAPWKLTCRNCYSQLTHYKPGSEWGWELEAAEKIEQIDPTNLRFRLEKGITFTGGYGEMTARDAKFYFERLFKNNSPSKPNWGSFDMSS
ncbi:hypothetical protein NKJ46_22950 [Mesorhizobium sp. M0166]|uniref:hypothetical protein n=1 Tax=Mesorhizobium sp. M0166 TaxID=2956902 RepID=UPI003339D863